MQSLLLNTKAKTKYFTNSTRENQKTPFIQRGKKEPYLLTQRRRITVFPGQKVQNDRLGASRDGV